MRSFARSEKIYFLRWVLRSRFGGYSLLRRLYLSVALRPSRGTGSRKHKHETATRYSIHFLHTGHATRCSTQRATQAHSPHTETDRHTDMEHTHTVRPYGSQTLTQTKILQLSTVFHLRGRRVSLGVTCHKKTSDRSAATAHKRVAATCVALRITDELRAGSAHSHT